MSAEAGSLTTPITETTKKSSSFGELKVAVIPSLVTAVFGFFIWNAQSGIEQTVNSSNQILQTQMALKEDYFKRRLTVYEEACKKMTGLKSALDEAPAAPLGDTTASDKLKELYEFNMSNPIYLSKEVEQGLGKLWELGIAKGQNTGPDNTTVNTKFDSEITELHKQMKIDLKVPELTEFMKEEKTKPRKISTELVW